MSNLIWNIQGVDFGCRIINGNIKDTIDFKEFLIIKLEKLLSTLRKEYRKEEKEGVFIDDDIGFADKKEGVRYIKNGVLDVDTGKIFNILSEYQTSDHIRFEIWYHGKGQKRVKLSLLSKEKLIPTS